MEKVIRDGKVAVLYSPGYGAGWYSWSEDISKLFNPKIVHAIESKVSKDELLELANSEYPDDYNGGAVDLEIEWIPIGTQFKIEACDGYESIQYNYNDYWMVA